VSCAIQFCVKLNENAKQTYWKIKKGLWRACCIGDAGFKWHKTFLNGRESVKDEPSSRRPCTSNRAQMWPTWGLLWGLIDVWQNNRQWVARFNFVSNLMKTQQKLTKKLKRGLWRACCIEDAGFKWHKTFLNGRENVEDEPSSGRPCTSKRAKMWQTWGLLWGLIDVWQPE